jgi:subtilase family serine protease
VFTNYIVLVGESVMPFTSGEPQGETPDSIRTVYGLPTNGGGGTVAIVDAFNYPTAMVDLQTFSSKFNVPCDTCLEVKFASGTKPPDNCDWAGEAALDVQWVHASAPKAKILLVEAKSSSMPDMLAAVDYAANAVKQAGGGQVSLSWGSTEYATEASSDPHFAVPGVVFVASSGDVGGVQTYPSESTNVVAVGGTTIVRNGNQVKEEAWNGSGGGPSAFESRAPFQANLSNIPNTDPAKRWAPDVSADADPYSGVAVFDSTSCQGRSGWQVIGGTSLAAPLVAGMINVAKHSASGTQQEQLRMYSHAGDSTKFRDVTKGSAGSFSAGPGYDFITGLGSPIPLDFDKP